MTRHHAAEFGLSAPDVAPLWVELPHNAVTVTHADLAKHLGRDDVAGVSCTSNTYTTVEVGGASYPRLVHLHTGCPRLVSLMPGDSMRLYGIKPGKVELRALIPARQS